MLPGSGKMLLKVVKVKKNLRFGIIFSILLLNFALYANAVSDSEVKTVLKDVLFDYFASQQSSVLSLAETKDLLGFYLTTPAGQNSVDLSVAGANSGNT